jgi:hypothetical protein
MSAAVQLELFAAGPALQLGLTGARGFPMCEVCAASEGIGPACALCIRCWSSERDPVGAASWDDIEAAYWWQRARKRVDTVRVTGSVL